MFGGNGYDRSMQKVVNFELASGKNNNALLVIFFTLAWTFVTAMILCVLNQSPTQRKTCDGIGDVNSKGIHYINCSY